jgi:hypothetical protein
VYMPLLNFRRLTLCSNDLQDNFIETFITFWCFCASGVTRSRLLFIF